MSRPAFLDRTEGQVDRILDLARRHLEMDLVLLSEFAAGRQVHRAADGDTGSFEVVLGQGPPLERTLCARLVAGQLPPIVEDCATDPRACDLVDPVRPLGGYIGVPVTLPDGTLYGTFCGLSHAPRPDLQRRDVQLLSMLAEMLADRVAEQRDRDQRRSRIGELLDQRQVALALQPIVELSSGRTLSLEVLSRFPSDVEGPDAVFAQAHEVGLGVDLERMVVDQALALLPRLPPGQDLALNVSPAALLEIAGSRRARDHPALGRVMAEITEHEAVENYAELRDRLRPLRERGLRLAIDDAGAGYASLHHVIELRPELIKIDRSIISGLADDPARRSVVRTFVRLAEDLHAQAMAEGVESPRDLYAAVGLGIEVGQGYLLGRPTTDHERALGRLPALDVAAWTAEARLAAAAEDVGGRR